MTNQASEDELKQHFATLFYDDNYEFMLSKPDLFDVGAIEEAVELIRTEKLKLLAEVRERVVGENASKGTYMTYSNLTPVMQDFRTSICNDLKDDQRATLTKMEAEL